MSSRMLVSCRLDIHYNHPFLCSIKLQRICITLLSLIGCLTLALPLPDSQVNQEIDDLEDLLAVENQIDEGLIAIAPAPVGFPGERLVAIEAAPKDFPGERLVTNDQSAPKGSYAFR